VDDAGDGGERGIIVNETRRGKGEINGQRRVGHRSVYDFWYWREPINPKDNDHKPNPANQIIPVSKIITITIFPNSSFLLYTSLYSGYVFD
jgi:hypothetical protein